LTGRSQNDLKGGKEKIRNANIFIAYVYSFWQRAIHENINGLIHQYIAMKADFSKLTQSDIA
jgi:IS30 family transposase